MCCCASRLGSRNFLPPRFPRPHGSEYTLGPQDLVTQFFWPTLPYLYGSDSSPVQNPPPWESERPPGVSCSYPWPMYVQLLPTQQCPCMHSFSVPPMGWSPPWESWYLSWQYPLRVLKFHSCDVQVSWVFFGPHCASAMLYSVWKCQEDSSSHSGSSSVFPQSSCVCVCACVFTFHHWCIFSLHSLHGVDWGAVIWILGCAPHPRVPFPPTLGSLRTPLSTKIPQEPLLMQVDFSMANPTVLSRQTEWQKPTPIEPDTSLTTLCEVSHRSLPTALWDNAPIITFYGHGHLFKVPQRFAPGHTPGQIESCSLHTGGLDSRSSLLALTRTESVM